MNKSIIIIGAGMGGLAAGIYGQMNGYHTKIFEMHTVPGGQVAAWKRKGYTFDACIHHLFGCNDFSRIYRLWHEMGAMPRELVYIDDCVSVVSPEGRVFKDYYDLEKLERHLKELSPADARVIDDYIQGIRSQAKQDYFGEFIFGGTWDSIKAALFMLVNLRWFKPNMQDFASRFSDPFLRRAFPLLEYSLPQAPFFLHLIKHAYGYRKSIAWPVGGALEFACSIEKRYEELGGEVRCHQKVVKILSENDCAVGIRLADGSEHRADIIISNADGRKTILNMLEGKYINDRIKQYCAPPIDETNWAVLVFLGVARDLSMEPSGLVMLLDKPVTIANHENNSMEMQIYGFDKTMAPKGKGVIKVELVSQYSYWKKLSKDQSRYEEEKQKIAEQVIEQLSHYFKGIENQIEVVDVATIMTWEKFMGGTNGFNNFPVKKASFTASLLSKKLENTLPGLANFYLVGAWTTSAGATFMNALSGKKVIQAICKADGRKFTASVE
jgi:phytoene dehydrogenase-like protein